MVGIPRPSSARRAGSVGILRTSKSQPGPSGSRLAASARPSSAGGGSAARLSGIQNDFKVAKGGDGRRVGKKVLNWFRIPTTGGWVPTARAGHTAVTVGVDMIVFGGIVNGQRVNEMAKFDLNTRAWHRLSCDSTHSSTSKDEIGRTTLQTTPAPRAFHVSWSHGTDIYVHGGEGARSMEGSNMGGGGCFGEDFDGVFGGVGRDPFAEEDGGPPLERGRVIVGGQVRTSGPGSGFSGAGGIGKPQPSAQRQQQQQQRRWSVTILEDVWKLDSLTLNWERLPSRLAPLGRKGHTATVAPLRGQPCVFIFGGAPAGRRGLSQALYSVELSRLSIGEGTWDRHRPGGTAPAAREGHTFTVVGGGKRLVLFGGVGEDGELLRDVQILEIDDGRLSWAQVQTPVGEVPTPRHGHSACEVTERACFIAGIPTALGGVLIFGGEGRTNSGSDLRPTDSYEVFLYDPQASRWHAIETGHAFPIGRHGHSMALANGWTPPAFHPDGTLMGSEASPSNQGVHQQRTRFKTGTERLSSSADTATHQWGNRPPSCAVIFGGLNSMYVNPEVWVLPLRWREAAVLLSPAPSEVEETPTAASNLAFVCASRSGVATGAAFEAAADARARNIASTNGGSIKGYQRIDEAYGGGDAWRSWPGGGRANGNDSRGEGFVVANAEGGGGYVSTGAPINRRHKQKLRRASLPATAVSSSLATLGLVNSRLQVATDQAGAVAGFGEGDCGRTVGSGHEGGRVGATVPIARVGTSGAGEMVSAVEIEAELRRLRKVAYVTEQKLAAEVTTRRQLQQENEELKREAATLREARAAAEGQLRQEAKRQWREGQKARSRCGSLERLLAEAYDLINLAELQHHLQVRAQMSGLYRDRRKLATTAATTSPGEPMSTSFPPAATQPTATTTIAAKVDRNLTGAAATSTSVDGKNTPVTLGGLCERCTGVVVTEENRGRGGIGVLSFPDDLHHLHHQQQQRHQQQQQQQQSGRDVIPKDRPPNDGDDDEEERRDNLDGLPLPAENGVEKCRHRATSPEASTPNPALVAKKGRHLGDYHRRKRTFLGCISSHGDNHATSTDDRGHNSSSSSSGGRSTSTGTVAAGRLQRRNGKINPTSGVCCACAAPDVDDNFGALRVAAADDDAGGDLHGMMNFNGIAAAEGAERAKEAAVAKNGVGGLD